MAETRSIDFLLLIDKNFITPTINYQKIVELKIVYMKIRKLILMVSENQQRPVCFLFMVPNPAAWQSTLPGFACVRTDVADVETLQ